MNGTLVRPPVAVLLLFAFGFALSIFAGLMASNAAYARAQYTIWPCLLLGGWATAILIRRAPALGRTGWRAWWIGGLVAYLVHLWFGFGVIYGWSFAAVYAGQGSLVASANFALALLWLASALVPAEGRPWIVLHLATAALFIAASLGSTLLFARGPSWAGGLALAVAWLAALYLRLTRGEDR
ncbi:hypothetical protein SAMN06265365_11793 [Tistlia consotensis]|uniref:Uncharacterized protein n=1 Tax=Tistlia consotensis USBA 355 TaxID=560819 RepID=A0A1Y6CEN4_9PROT|nr:hypothetical protein [Tistlia consotensis]SMF51395.1 hypothetical protein SAMN05428998_11826 [Tistlia consotensis USBA 355]SNR84398.1 hypothetical protein SAMN06265365_11793 [Tistlia consotensis]